jgi:hypothetical protein
LENSFLRLVGKIDCVLRSFTFFGHCKLFDQLRYEAQKPPTFTEELVLDKIWSEKVQKFLRKMRLGFTKELNYKLIPRNNEENTDSLMSEEFDVGTFE